MLITLPQVSISVGTLLLLFSAVYCLLIAYIEEAFALYLTENEVELGMLSGQSPDLSESKLAKIFVASGFEFKY